MKLIPWLKDWWRLVQPHVTAGRASVVLEAMGLLVAVMVWTPWR
ncbi:hypothetical protein [Streptomyces sp. AS02]|nr:hypothetical protein [Streptomyces sp. AS02]